MDYIPHNPEDIKKMMEVVGISDFSELYRDIPQEILLNEQLNIAGGWSEFEVARRVTSLANQNTAFCLSLAGAGIYFHYQPAVVNHVLLRSEFFTAYTPYQPEVSQGMLQAIFEYQSMICALTGMYVANASMYDGASAVAEACVMSLAPGPAEILILEGLHPEYEQVIGTYLDPRGVKVVKGEADPDSAKALIRDETKAVVLQSPNFFGEILDVAAITQAVKEVNPKVLVIQVITDLTSLGLLKPPAECGVDIVAGEGQSLGLAPSFGGPTLGVLTATEALLRKMPGRIVGETVDNEGRRGFVLTLQAREQHIRREKATSNICSNQALCMLGASVYLSTVGASGLRNVAEASCLNAKYLREKLAEVPGVEIVSKPPCFHEFVAKLPNSDQVQSALVDMGFCPPVDLGRFFPARKGELLFCVTEDFRQSDLDDVVAIVQEAASA
jgi:glycine dehydrogenase subunit 1